MLLSVQQKYILEVLRRLGCVRKDQIQTLVQGKFGRPDLEITQARMEAIDVMLELSEGAPQNFSAKLDSSRLLRFGLGGDKLKLFSVAQLSHISDPQLVQQERSERIVWISDSGTPPDGLTLPPKHFFAAWQADGSHRFYGSNGL